MSTEQRCACGQPLHYSDPAARAYTEEMNQKLGEHLLIRQARGVAYLVPRHYIALHGIKAWELADLAARYGWAKV